MTEAKKQEGQASSMDETTTTTQVAPPKAGCTLYLGRLPHGFYEEEIRGYFSQFGQISRLRVSRNKTTGAPKHYAYLEFEHAEVARIVAETMHNYLLFGHLIQCKVVPEARLHPALFLGANRKFVKIPWKRIAQNQFNKRHEREADEKKNEERAAKGNAEGAKRIESVKSRAAARGIDYDFGSVVKTQVQ
jgi:nucleolar protein 15